MYVCDDAEGENEKKRAVYAIDDDDDDDDDDDNDDDDDARPPGGKSLVCTRHEIKKPNAIGGKTKKFLAVFLLLIAIFSGGPPIFLRRARSNYLIY